MDRQQAIGEDITESKQDEERRQEGFDLLKNLARLVPGVIYQYRLYPDGRSAFPYSSPGLYDIYEVTPEEVREDASVVFGRIHPEDRESVSNAIFESARTLKTFQCELRVVLPKQGLRWRWSQAHPERTADGGTLWHGIILDITERKRAETYRELSREILQILNEPGDLQETIQQVLAALKRRTGVDAVGLRLQEGDDFPYFVQDGFSKDFLLTENTLVERDKDGGVCRDKDGNVRLECTCGLVISGRTDPSNPLFTKGGSCWMNDSSPLLELPIDQDLRLHPRNNCVHQGYASVALIPIGLQDQMYSRGTCVRHGFSSVAQVPVRTSDRIVGLIQLNDKRKGCFTLETIEILEGIASHIGSALMRKQAEEEYKYAITGSF